jgi:2-oxo-4-hydroxy-4-carboxy--5-ureidoimidazoline (OHCU) decarboxylase
MTNKRKKIKKLCPILSEEKDKFDRLWHAYHNKYKIPYLYRERDAIFNSIALIFLEDK